MHPLIAAVAEGRPDALEHLRAACAAGGGPLCEPDGARTTVTFVWIGDDGPVALQSGLFRSGISRAMARVGDAPVWWIEVEMPAGALVAYRFVVDDPFQRGTPADDAGWIEWMIEAHARSFADPWSTDRIAPIASLFGLPTAVEQFESILSLPGAPSATWFAAHDAPRGPVTSFVHRSDALGNERDVTVWLPADASGPMPLVVLLDGESFVHLAGIPRAFDAAMAKGDLPPIAIACVSGPQGAAGFTERTPEMSCNPVHATMLARELIPRLRDELPVMPTADGTILGGASLGGLQSMYTAIEHREVVGNVVSVSGSFWYGVDADGRPERLTRRIAAEAIEPLRIYQQIGVLEDGPLGHTPGVTHLDANRRFHEAALAAGHEVHYDELVTAHDVCAFRIAVIRGLQALLPSRT